MEHKPTIVEMMSESLSKIRDMVDVNTVVGDPITTPDGTTIIPVSRLSFGFAAGGTNWAGKEAEKSNFGGGAGAGVGVTPVSFLIVTPSGVKVLPMQPGSVSTVEKVIDMVPEIVDKVDEMLKKYKK